MMQLDHPPTPGTRSFDWVRPDMIAVRIDGRHQARISVEEVHAQLDLIAAHSLSSVELHAYWFDESDLSCFARQMEQARKLDGLRTGVLS